MNEQIQIPGDRTSLVHLRKNGRARKTLVNRRREVGESERQQGQITGTFWSSRSLESKNNGKARIVLNTEVT